MSEKPRAREVAAQGEPAPGASLNTHAGKGAKADPSTCSASSLTPSGGTELAPVSAYCVELGIATRPYPGQSASGDGYLAHCLVGEGMLVAVIDGLGHGPEAEAASRAAIKRLRAMPSRDLAQHPLERLLDACHESLRPTRGAAVSLARFPGNPSLVAARRAGERKAMREATAGGPTPAHVAGPRADEARFEPMLEWVGVGNVEGIHIPAGKLARTATGSLPLRGGVVGARLPPRLAATRLPVSPGDLVVFFTDGVDPRFADLPFAVGPSQAIADRILAKYARATDDALVVVARYKSPHEVAG